ncbi:MAG: hypothetical protein ABJQ29_06490 [Luteolibacter sp.]
MNPDFNDPNNHVPPVSKDDDWDDGEDAADALQRSLPPKRIHGGVPGRKDGRVLTTEHTEPKLKVAVVKTEAREEAGDTAVEAEKSEPALPPKRPLRKNSVKPMAAPKGSVSKEEESAATSDEADEAPASRQDRVVLPSLEAKRFHVKEIGKADSMSFPRPDPAKMPAKGAQRARMAGGGRRWFKDAEAGSWGSKAGTGNHKWMIYAGLGAMGLVVGIVFLSVLVDDEEGQRDQSFYSTIEVKEDEAPKKGEVEDFDELDKSRNRAVEIYAKYATSDDSAELKGLLYEESEVFPLLAENWKALSYPDGWVPDYTAQWSATERHGIKYGILEGNTPEFDRFRAIFRNEGEELKLDWKATVGYGTADFEDLVAGRGDGSLIRGYLSIADFYTFSFPESEFQSYRFASPTGETSIWVYAGRGSGAADRFSEVFAASEITGEVNGVAEVTLSLDPGNEESLPNQWQIQDLLRMGWLEE